MLQLRQSVELVKTKMTEFKVVSTFFFLVCYLICIYLVDFNMLWLVYLFRHTKQTQIQKDKNKKEKRKEHSLLLPKSIFIIHYIKQQMPGNSEEIINCLGIHLLDGRMIETFRV